MTHLLRYLLIFGDRKKKVELSVGQELENVKVETLKHKARELFNLKNVLLQIWDKGFEDWVDLDEGDPTPTNSRIKVEVDKKASSAAVAPKPQVMSLSKPKVDSPAVQVRSSCSSSYPPIALTTTEIPIALPTQKSLVPPLSRLTQSQSVTSKQSPGRALPAVGQRQYLGEQPPGSSSSAPKAMVGVGQSVQDIRSIPTIVSQHSYSIAPIHSQDRPVVEYIQQSFSLPSRIPERTLLPPREDAPTRPTPLHTQNKPVLEGFQQSLPMPYEQSSRIPDRTLQPSLDSTLYRLTTPHSQNKPVYETVQQSFPATPYMKSSRVPERGLPPSQDVEPYRQHRISSHVQNTPLVQIIQESFPSQPYEQTLRIPERNLPTSQDKAPPPIIIEDNLSSITGQEKEQMEDIDTAPSLDRGKLSHSDYKLPKFPADIIQKLEDGLPIEAKERSILLDVLYESVVPYTYYPLKSDYTYLTNKLLERFPQLLSQAGPIRDSPYNWEAWREKLMHKFKNMRKRKDRDTAAVQQRARKNVKYFGGLDKLQSTSEQALNDREDHMDSDTPSETDEEVFEVVDDVQDVVIKEEDSMYHVMAADTTNLLDTPVIGIVQESISWSPYMQSSRNLPISRDNEPYGPTTSHSQNKTVMAAAKESLNLPTYTQRSRIPERIGPPFQDMDSDTPSYGTLQSQNVCVMECVQESLPSSSHMPSSRILKRRLPPSEDNKSYQQTTAHVQKEPVLNNVEEPCLSKSNIETQRIPERSLPPSQNHSQDNAPNQQTMSYSQNQPAIGVEQQSCSSPLYRNTSKTPESASQEHVPSTINDQELSSNKGQEDRWIEDERIMSVLTSDPDKPSLYTYKLPTFPADIIQKLENGIPIEPKDRSILFDTLYESIVPYTYYPSAADYIYFTNIFLARFPQLLPQVGPIRDCPDNWEAWRQKLMHKFKNMRKRKDRDVAAVQQRTRKNVKYFEGLDELQSTSGQAVNDSADQVDSDCPSETDEEVFEVVDDDQDVVIKEEDSMYHVMPADTTNLLDTPVVGVVQESISSSLYMQSSRIPERNLPISRNNEPYRPTTSHAQNETVMAASKESLNLPTNTQRSRIPERIEPPFRDDTAHRLTTLQSQNVHVMECVQDSLPSSSPMQSSRTLKKSLPHSQDDISFQQTTAHLQQEPVMEVVEESCLSKSNMETQRNPQSIFPPSQDNVPNQQTMSYSQNQPAIGVEQQSCSSQFYRHTSQIPESTSQDHVPSTIIDQALSSNKSQEDRWIEDEHIMSALTSDPNKPSLYSYKLPSFPSGIIQKLENGIPIDVKDRSILLDVIYESIVPYTYYPTAADYIYFTNMFLERFPQLLPQAGPIRDCPDNWEAWRQKLMHKFKNMRKRKDRDVAAVQQHTRKNFRYFEGLDELQSTSGQAMNDGGDQVDSDCPSETDEEVLEVVDDDQDVVIKEEDSMYHVMAADTTNVLDTPVIGVVQESNSSSPYMQSSRVTERNLPIYQDNEPYRPTTSHSPNKTFMKAAQESLNLPTYTPRSRILEMIGTPFQDDSSHQLTTLQSQNFHFMKCVQESLPSSSHMQSSRILKRSLPSEDNKSYQQTTAHLQKKPVLKIVEESCSSMLCKEMSRISERSLPPSQDHSQDNAPNQQTMSYSKNQPDMGVDHAPSTITDQELSSNKGQEDRSMEVEHIMSVLTSDPEKPSLYTYKLPNFPAGIIQKLENGIPIDPKDRSILLDTLYESIVPYTYYPSASDYIYFTSVFLERFPQLLPQVGPIRDCPDNWEAWKHKLMHKFKNMRKRKDRDVASVQQHIRKNVKYFEGLEELQSTSGKAVNDRGDQVSSDTPSETDEEVFEVVDDDQAVVIKEEDSMYHVMAADTTNLSDT